MIGTFEVRAEVMILSSILCSLSFDGWISPFVITPRSAFHYRMVIRRHTQVPVTIGKVT